MQEARCPSRPVMPCRRCAACHRRYIIACVGCNCRLGEAAMAAPAVTPKPGQRRSDELKGPRGGIEHADCRCCSAKARNCQAIIAKDFHLLPGARDTRVLGAMTEGGRSTLASRALLKVINHETFPIRMRSAEMYFQRRGSRCESHSTPENQVFLALLKECRPTQPAPAEVASMPGRDQALVSKVESESGASMSSNFVLGSPYLGKTCRVAGTRRTYQTMTLGGSLFPSGQGLCHPSERRQGLVSPQRRRLRP
jgi:hypothetical protein